MVEKSVVPIDNTTMAQPISIPLVEFESTPLAAPLLSAEDIRYVKNNFKGRIAVFSSDSIKGGAPAWHLRPEGVVGQLSLPSGLRLSISPKVPVQQLFQMLAVVYPSIRPRVYHFDVTVGNETHHTLFLLLIEWLCHDIEILLERGLNLSFEEVRDLSPVVRGRIDPTWVARHPHDPRVMTEYSQLTVANPYNEVLSATLQIILQAASLPPSLSQQVAYLRSYLPASRTSDPLMILAELEDLRYGVNQADYERCHALCELILRSFAPTNEAGRNQMPSFLIDMAPLFERFVVCWLKEHLPPHLSVAAQKRKRLDATRPRTIAADILIVDVESRLPQMVLDTKYKGGDRPDLTDLYQVTFYAAEFGVRYAGLVYPHVMSGHIAGQSRQITYESLSFDLSRPLDEAGNHFIETLLTRLSE